MTVGSLNLMIPVSMGVFLEIVGDRRKVAHSFSLSMAAITASVT